MAFSAVSGITTPFPDFSITGGSVVGPSVVRLSPFKTPLPSFAPNSNVTTWANPLVVSPIKPLPQNGTGGGGQVGYPN